MSTLFLVKRVMVLSKNSDINSPIDNFNGKIKISVELVEFVLSDLIFVFMLCQPNESVLGLKINVGFPSMFNSCLLDLLITYWGSSPWTDKTSFFLVILLVPFVWVM